MHIQELSKILQQPEKLKAEQTHTLKAIVDKYPYFQAVRALYLKSLKNNDSYKYNHALKTTAAHTTDRSILFDFITSEAFNQNEVSQQIKQNSEHIKNTSINDIENIPAQGKIMLDDKLTAQISATKGVLDPNLFVEKKIKDTKEEIEEEKSNLTPNNPLEKLQIGKPLEFDATETYSFSEWLKITSFSPIIREKKEEKTADIVAAPLMDKLKTIDKFILENPKIKPTQQPPKPKLITQIEPEEDSLMTETLARIYLEQKRFDKAIQSYRILSLKYPEKSTFFANQIKAVKELKERNNSINND